MKDLFTSTQGECHVDLTLFSGPRESRVCSQSKMNKITKAPIAFLSVVVLNLVGVVMTPTAQAQEYENTVSSVGNYSLGGDVRSGPGTQFGKVDALPYGEPVVLLERSGVNWDGYEWFKIEFSEGVVGYQWGGIMCSNALHIPGLYDPCPNDFD